ncbi:Putative dihydrodipicolinate synthetase [Komagataella phaffii CBS 7435]|uniref:Dihydrodipicolinate synthase n=2 Tax=Komagataella phaffii TaxID=460519 RepID=C4R8B1_KOMPG|nr:Hypothetical protein PAS_chr4_0577 [Komagataella phaffii GS115]AOA64552.1 GQ67_04948T0 [Komagataella phaffii]CAH2450768.1 Putative dihydrodipicolinate synthetase [Komagataella phaffii CBS 7435]AOA69925.1 GQ68_04929T0 [Komagataella phaffii GS115]CAY71836.1 Hypothetical protein PAS_chr4_0577 [Komagataella phaffii GS115]CCA40562.1 Putative dihydrodipicolinate synthetase [Komagataella phaffii CBS 7435]
MVSYKVLSGGVYSPLPTFFKNDAKKSLDLEAQVAHARHLYDSGIKGILVGGSIGEAIHLTEEERLTLIRTLHKAVPEFTIIAGVIGYCIEDIIRQISVSKENGASYSVILVPGYYGPSLVSQKGIISWFNSIADKAELPIILYNYPGVQNGIQLTFDSYKELSRHEKIVGCKLTHYDFTLYTLVGKSTELRDNNFSPFAGVGQVLVPALSVGIEGVIDGLSTVFPKSMIHLFNLYQEGKTEEASKLQELVTAVNEMTAVLNLLGIKYAIKHRFGLGESLVGRPPLDQEIDITVWDKHYEDFKKLEALEESL